MTASDARPPSDTGTTGWHTHGTRDVQAYRDDWCLGLMGRAHEPRPVLVVDPPEAREKIKSGLLMRATYYDIDPTFVEGITDNILAALAGQGGDS